MDGTTKYRHGAQSKSIVSRPLCFRRFTKRTLELVLNPYLFTSVKSDNDFDRGDLRRTYRKTELFLCYPSAKIPSYLQRM